MTSFPAVDDYRALFALASYWLQPSQKRMLESHLRAPNHTATATELAEKMGYPNYGTVNMLYGSLAATVTAKLNLNKVDWSVPDGEPQSVSLVIFDRTGPEEHWKWIMRPELVDALTDLGWK